MIELEKKLNRQVLGNIFLPLIITTLSAVVISDFEFRISWILVPVLTLIFELVFKLNTNYLIELSSSKSNRTIEVTYYNFVDKIKTEEFKMTEILKLERNKKNTRTKIELKNYRILVLHHVDDIIEKTLTNNGEQA